MPNFLKGGARIYAPPSSPFRLLARLDATGEELHPQIVEETNRSDTYMTTLLKLVPAEVVSLYMAFRDSFQTHELLWVLFVLCLVTCIILRVYANMPKTQDASWSQTQKTNVLLSCVAFVLWAHAIGPKPPIPHLNLENWLAAPLVAIFSVLAPIFAPGDKSAPGH
jgi:hypothetical protein